MEREMNVTGYLILIIVIWVSINNNVIAQDEICLSGDGWNVWLDEEATWENDQIFLPKEVGNIDDLPHNAPSCGWENMYQNMGINCRIPASVEEYFSKANSHWQYHGVSWFWKTIEVPKAWKGKVVRIYFEATRFRAELYVNNDLGAYDIIPELPWGADISKYIKYGKKNIIALRLTNPGGVRGWNDGGFEMKNLFWGKYQFPQSHDFSGIGGDVTIVASEKTYVEDIFVRNLRSNKKGAIEVITTINNLGRNNSGELQVRIYSTPENVEVFNQSWDIDLEAKTNEVITKSIFVPEAKQWNINTPNIYICEVSLCGKSLNDTKKQSFGFRVFEVKENHGDNFYFNGERIRFRSAVDWMYFDHHGMYPSEIQAERCIQTVKDIGQNGLNGHRFVTYQRLFELADEKGVYMYQEPGGFHNCAKDPFTSAMIKEKLKRIVLRNRNNPSLTTINLSNEDGDWNSLREEALTMVSELSGRTLYVTNTSGPYTKSNVVHTIRPYEKEIRKDHMDAHWLDNGSRFQERHFGQHRIVDDSKIIYWGECHMYSGPVNAYAIAEEQKTLPANKQGYNLNWYMPQHDLVETYFNQNKLNESGSRSIKTPSDVSKLMGNGLMYSFGRVCQEMMSHNSSDGYAFNGWGEGGDDFTCGLLNGNRTLKGDINVAKYWIRDLQIVVQRQNGKYFKVGEKAKFDLRLINEGKLPSGNYTLKIAVKDGDGKLYPLEHNQLGVFVKGGDEHVQILYDDFEVKMSSKWKGGHITLEASLLKDGKQVTDGKEQVLLSNRKSFKNEVATFEIAVLNWPEAKKAIVAAGGKAYDFSSSTDKQKVIFAAAEEAQNKITKEKGSLLLQDFVIDELLTRVKNDGTTLILKFDSLVADILFEKGVLSEKVTIWKGDSPQKKNTAPHDFNGWGYIDYFTGNQSFPFSAAVSTNSWEVPSEPLGFWPFRSNYEQTSYGAYMFRGPLLEWDRPYLTVLLGEINYGKGKIILNPCYHVDENNPFTDLMFYKLIEKVTVKEYMKPWKN